MKVASRLTEEILDPYDFRSGKADAISIEKRTDIILRALLDMQTFCVFDRERERWLFAGTIHRRNGSLEYVGDKSLAKKISEGELDAYLTVNVGRIVTGYLDRLEKFTSELEKGE